MNRIKAISLLAISVLALQLHAQQDVQFTQYMHNRIFFNPGIAGNSDAISLNFGHRTQWVGFDNAPVTQNINAELPVDKLHGGVMLNITNDQIGFFQDISAALGYAYQTYVGPGKLGIGASVDFRNKNVRNAQWIFPDGGAGSNDPAVMTPSAQAMAPEINFGAYYSTDQWYAGLSSSRLLQSNQSLPGLGGGTAAYRSVMHYYLMGGYNFELASLPGIRFAPSALLRADASTMNLHTDLNFNAVVQDKIYGGLGYRFQDALSLMAGYQVMPSLRVSYSYDINTSPVRAYNGGSHEIFVNYQFTIEIPPRIKGSYRTPIFL
jgi:type IX secretion system PorP/SprF family membrane protein